MISFSDLFGFFRKFLHPVPILAAVALFAVGYAALYQTAYDLTREQRDDYKAYSESLKTRNPNRPDSLLSAIEVAEIGMPLDHYLSVSTQVDSLFPCLTNSSSADSFVIGELLPAYRVMLQKHEDIKRMIRERGQP